jgi:hypothetical protein
MGFRMLSRMAQYPKIAFEVSGQDRGLVGKRIVGAETSYESILPERFFAEAGIADRQRHKLIMNIGGWKTRSMFDRYTITDPEAMRRAMAIVIKHPKPTSPKPQMNTEKELPASRARIQ